MTHLVFFLEEPSAEALLKKIVPRLLVHYKNVSVYYIVFEGKQDLEKKLSKRLNGWRRPNSRFIVMRDQDMADCKQVKSRLQNLCPNDKLPHTLVRIACHELESWYLADLQAVEQGLMIPGVAAYQNKKKYRNPDLIQKPSKELQHLTKMVYQKISGSRAIGEFLKLDNTRSKSFSVFVDGIEKILGCG